MLSENTSSIGRPEISLTENKDPLKLSVTLNNSPCEPCTVNTGKAEPDPYTVNEEPDAVFCELDIIVRDAVTFSNLEFVPNHKTDPSSVRKCGDAAPLTPLASAEYRLKLSADDVVGDVPFFIKKDCNIFVISL